MTAAPTESAPTLTLASWNINSLAVRLPQVLAWLADNPVDVLGLQELKLTDDKFPAAEFAQAGYHASVFGQKTYNGVALLTKQPLADVQRGNPYFADEHSRLIAGTLPCGTRLINAYFVNGQAPGTEKFAYKMRWLDGLQQWLKAELAQHPQLVLMGDFNITHDDRDSYDPVGLAETIHHTTQERAHLQALLDAGLHDAFRCFAQPERSYSWWDYRDMAFRRKRGLRIDFVLVSTALRARLHACTIDTAPRKNERPSDHAPVIATLVR